MGRKCAAFMCNKTVVHGVKLFKFPKNYTHNWILAVDRGPNWTPSPCSSLCSDHFPQEAFIESDKKVALKVGSEPNPGRATSISEQQKQMIVSKIRADNYRQEENIMKNQMDDIMSKENPDLWEVVSMLRETECQIQEFAIEVASRFPESDPLGDHKVLVEKIINDIKITQNKVEEYIFKESVNMEPDIDLKIPKLEPGLDGENFEEAITQDSVAQSHTITNMMNPYKVESMEPLELDADNKELGFNSMQITNEDGIINEGHKENNSLEEHIIDISKLKISCRLCESQKLFLSPKKRNEHVLEEHGQPPYQCCKCDQKYETYLKFASHFKTVHNKALVECTVCHKELKRAQLRPHMMIHTGERPHSCDVCGKSFILKSKLNAHLRVHTGERPYKCKLCSNTYKQGAHLMHHVRSVHQGIKQQSKKDMPEHEKEALKRVCGVCGKILASDVSLKVHERIHTGVKPYSCHLCSKSFSQHSGLLTHMDGHKDTKDYSCELCDKTFKHKHSAYLHRKAHDGSLKNSYFCELCSQKFSSSNNLKRHISVTHHKIKLHSCDICEKSFGSKTEVNQHMRVHTGEKPFQCEICNKSFTQSSSLYSHNRNNHAPVGE